MPDDPAATRVEPFDDRVEITIGTLDAGQRLDKFLRKILPGAKLGFLFKIIDRGGVRVDGARARPGARLGAGQIVRLPFGGDTWGSLSMRRGAKPATAPAGQLDVRFEDDAVLAVAKPSGVATHGGHDSLGAIVGARLGGGGALSFRPAPAHRLDRATSGIVLFGKTPAAQRTLVAAFKARAVEKHYVAIVAGHPTPATGVLRHRLERVGDAPAGPKVRVASEGVEAETAFRVIATAPGAALVALQPRTGRTHQLRVQLAAVGHPILGDRRYGGAPAARLALHAHRVALAHPSGGAPLAVEAPIPADLERLLRARGLDLGPSTE